MTILEIGALRYTDSGVNININTKEFGWIDFHATPTDLEELGRSLYTRAISGGFGSISPKLEV